MLPRIGSRRTERSASRRRNVFFKGLHAREGKQSGLSLSFCLSDISVTPCAMAVDAMVILRRSFLFVLYRDGSHMHQGQ